MKLFQRSGDNLDEIVFENRNKLYGAYAIRKEYDANLLKAAVSSFLLLMLFVCLVFVASLFKPEAKPLEMLRSLPAQGEKMLSRIKIIPDELFNAAAAKVETPQFKIVADHKVKPPVVQKPELPGSTPGNEAGTGKGEGNTLPGAGSGGETGTKEGEGKEPIIETPQAPVRFAEVMPSFPGGVDEMRDYLTRNLHYPENAMRMGVEGKVMISFVVNTNGEITEIRVHRSMGFGCDDEAVRVVSGMPRWTPGKQNGKLIPVQLLLPIHFKLQ